MDRAGEGCRGRERKRAAEGESGQSGKRAEEGESGRGLQGESGQSGRGLQRERAVRVAVWQVSAVPHTACTLFTALSLRPRVQLGSTDVTKTERDKL